MAIAIKSIPTLKNDAAKAFVQNAEAATSKRGTVNFSKQVASTRTILKKSSKSPLYAKISSSCKAAAKRKFKVWPSAYASGWGVRCTKAGGPSKFGNGKK